jgi:hypothetical protein
MLIRVSATANNNKFWPAWGLRIRCLFAADAPAVGAHRCLIHESAVSLK